MLYEVITQAHLSTMQPNVSPEAAMAAFSQMSPGAMPQQPIYYQLPPQYAPPPPQYGAPPGGMEGAPPPPPPQYAPQQQPQQTQSASLSFDPGELIKAMTEAQIKAAEVSSYNFV